MKNFRLFVIARFLGTIATQIQSVAVGWQVYEKTGNTLNLGLIGLAQFLPFVFLILIAGYTADQFNRRWIMTLCFLVEMLCGVSLLSFSWFNITSVLPIFAVMALYGAARAFMMPASQAILPNLVPEKNLNKAIALNSSLFHIAVIIAPPLGGWLYLFGTQVVYGVVTSLFGFAAFLMLFVRFSANKNKKREPISWHGVFEGLRFVRSKPVILGALSLDLFAVLFGGATALLPAYASDILHTDSLGLGLLRTAPALGAALTAILLNFFPIVRYVGWWMFNGVFLFGISTVIFGFSDIFLVSLSALFLMGAGDMVSVYVRHTLVQLETPDVIRGRVSAVNSVFIGASNELGEFESGLTATWLGLVPAVVAGGFMTIGVTFVCIFAFPVLRKMDKLNANSN